MSTTPEQLALRKHGLGATDCAAVLGLSEFKTPLQVWTEKRGLVEPPKQNEAMYWGLALEPLVAERYAKETGRVLWHPEQVYHHPKHDFIACTPDRLVEGEPRGVECKTTSAWNRDKWGRPGTDEIPAGYVVQCLVCMACTGLRVWDVPVLIGGNEWRCYTVAWDAVLWAEMEARLVAWWQRHMVEGVEPPAVAADNGWLASRYPDADGTLAPATDEVWQFATNRKLAVDALKQAEAAKDTAEAMLKALIGSGDGFVGADGDWRVTWRNNRPTTETDWEEVARELAQLSPEALTMLPEVVKHHTTTKPGARVLRYTEKRK